jgi:hypothetical protein
MRSNSFLFPRWDTTLKTTAERSGLVDLTSSRVIIKMKQKRGKLSLRMDGSRRGTLDLLTRRVESPSLIVKRISLRYILFMIHVTLSLSFKFTRSYLKENTLPLKRLKTFTSSVLSLPRSTSTETHSKTNWSASLSQTLKHPSPLAANMDFSPRLFQTRDQRSLEPQ